MEMTPQETLNWCERFTDNLVLANVDTSRRTLGLQAMQIIKPALEKQIPKRPIVKKLGGDIEVKCPSCGDIHIYLDAKKGDNYCCKCGQLLDFG